MKELIERFYQCFSTLDAEGMAACYHDEIVFADPAFGELRGEKARNMWRMLCASQKNKDFKIKVAQVTGNDQEGYARWEAFYTFSKTGRRVHNTIDAKFRFREGLIIEHTDRFDLYRWSKQAMGVQGYLIGWTKLFQRKLISQTQKILRQYEERR